MSHAQIERAEPAEQQQLRPSATSDALQTQAAKLLSGPAGADAQAAQQAVQFAQQGLQDLGTQNELTGILGLMKAAQLKPDLVRDQAFFGSLKSITGDVLAQGEHDESHHYQPVSVQDQASPTDGSNQNSAATVPSEVQGPTSIRQDAVLNTDGMDQSTQLIQQGLSAIASGDKLTGIVSLMQAAQSNPRIVSDARFQMALQNALSQAVQKQSGRAADVPLEVTGQPAAPSPRGLAEQPLS